MKSKVTDSEFVAQRDEDCLTGFRQDPDCSSKNYANRLRALGQALEKFSFVAFDLEISSGIYLVTAQTHPPERIYDSITRFVSESFRLPSFPSSSIDAGRQVALRFSAAEIEHFDRHGKNRRRDFGKTPDPCSVSQLMRSAGCYLDDRGEVSHVKISLRGRWVVVRYQTLQEHGNQIKHDLDCFYDYWIKMYLRRSSRVEKVVPTDPTVLVTGQRIHHANAVQAQLRINHNEP